MYLFFISSFSISHISFLCGSLWLKQLWMGKGNALWRNNFMWNLRSVCPNSCLCQEICPEGKLAQVSVGVLQKVRVLTIKNWKLFPWERTVDLLKGATFSYSSRFQRKTVPMFVTLTLFCAEPCGTDTASWSRRGQELPKRDWIEDTCVQGLQVTEKQPGFL